MKTQKDELLYFILVTMLCLCLLPSVFDTIAPAVTCLFIRQLFVALRSAATSGLAGSLALSHTRR
jgi:hypothetical protein